MFHVLLFHTAVDARVGKLGVILKGTEGRVSTVLWLNTTAEPLSAEAEVRCVAVLFVNELCCAVFAVFALSHPSNGCKTSSWQRLL